MESTDKNIIRYVLHIKILICKTVFVIEINTRLILLVRNSYGNDLNGFGKLIACSLWEQYDFFDFRSIWGPTGHFTI